MTTVSNKTRIRFFVSAVLLSAGLVAMSMWQADEEPQTVSLEAKSAVYQLPIEIISGKGKPKKDFIEKHLRAAKKYGTGSIKNDVSLKQKVAQGDLVEVLADEGYVLNDMTHSYPYLTKEALAILRTIGSSFYAASGTKSYFTVTSLTRTVETQNALRKRNSNAARDESSHCYGVSFDISYIRYDGKRAWNKKLTTALEGILATLQKQGKIYVVRENKQSCFHITVRT